MRDWDNLVGRAVRATEAAFGRDVTFTSGAPVPVGQQAPAPVTRRAVFDAAHEMVDNSGAVPFSTTGPVVDVRASDLPWTPAAGDRVTVDGTTYTAVDVQPDGAGTLRLILRKGALTRW